MAQHLGVAAQRTAAAPCRRRKPAAPRAAGVLVAFVGAGGVGDHGGIELLAEFAAHLGDAALGVFGELQRLGAVLHRGNRLARLVFEVVQHALQLLLQLADLLALLLLALGLQGGCACAPAPVRARPAGLFRYRARATASAGGRGSGRRPGSATTAARAPSTRSARSGQAAARC